MVDVRITLSGLWTALMLTYLLGDVLRILSGDADEFIAGIGRFEDIKMNQWAWVGMAALMLIPIVMLVLSLTLPYPAIRWLTVVAAALLFLVNVVGLPTYEGLYDKFLIVVGLGFNVVTVWYAWTWHLPG